MSIKNKTMNTAITDLKMSEEKVSELVSLFKGIIKVAIIESDLDISIEKIDIIGSRRNGTHRSDSDLDVLLVYSGDVKEYEVHNFFYDVFHNNEDVSEELEEIEWPIDIFVLKK